MYKHTADHPSIVQLVQQEKAQEELDNHHYNQSIRGPFHRLGVDVLQLPLTEAGNWYVEVFMDYLTKWAEAFAVPDQSAETIVRLLKPLQDY